ncbi:MAG: hypothetical protein LBL74_06980 [Bacteroidales bacterium]|jgi:hypothetical protein|nr:hypothetical protein [Bacteroidales bacterium]
MIKKTIVILLLVFAAFGAYSQASQDVAIGKWREHLAYYSANNVADLGDRMLVSAQSSLFYFNKKTHQMERFSKVGGLSDAGVHLLAYDPQTKTSVIVYTNANIDIVQGENVYNISDLRLKTIEGSKEINNITFAEGKAFLACGFGIVVLNLLRHEIYDTYFIGENSSTIKINQVALNDTSIFAATENYGVLYAPRYSNMLAMSESWKNLSAVPIYAGDTSTSIDTLNIKTIFTLPNNDLVIGLKKTSSDYTNVFRYNGTTLDSIFKNEYIHKIFLSENKVVKIAWQAVNVYDDQFNQLNVFSTDPQWNPSFRYNGEVLEMNVNDAVIDGSKIWFAHQDLGLIEIDNYLATWQKANEYYPNGPLVTSSYRIRAGKDGTIYVAPTAFKGFEMANVFIFDGQTWSSLTFPNDWNVDSLKSVCDVAIDPRDASHLMLASWWNGVLEVKDNKIVKVWDTNNTDGILQNTYGVRSSWIEYDKFNNLLVTNSLGDYGLAYYTNNNQWGGFYTADLTDGAEILGFVIDTLTNYKLVWTGNNRLILLNNEGGRLLISPNTGAKDRTFQINCAVQDMDGEIWLGTEKGIKVIYSLLDAFSTNIGQNATIECNNIVYDDNGVLQYLLNFDNINCIMVDGGNRKWIGTERSGIYVYSPNGSKEILHFTAENSPLLSNNVTSMAQNPLTGEVFIATGFGIVSYKAESTKGAEKAGSLTVYPNPVRPDYTGDIAINGFVADSDVKITDVGGNIVAHLQSIGGQAVWNGCNMNKEKVSSGVYLVFGSAQDGTQNAVGKILIIR